MLQKRVRMHEHNYIYTLYTQKLCLFLLLIIQSLKRKQKKEGKNKK